MRSPALFRLLAGLALVALTLPLRAGDDEPQDRVKEAPKGPAVEGRSGARKEMNRERRVPEFPDRGRRDREQRSEDGDARRLQERLTDLRLQYKELFRTRGPDHPEVRTVQESIAMVERMLREPAERRERQGDRDRGSRPEFRPQADRLEAAMQRARHFRQAAEHLQMADAHDLADDLRRKAEAMERDVQEAKRRMQDDQPRQRDGGRDRDGAGDLRAEVERLRAEVRELREQLERRRPPADLPRKKEPSIKK